MPPDDNKTIVRRVFEELDKHNYAVLDEVMVADYMHHDPALPPQMQRGRDNYRQGTAMFYTAFPDLRGTLEDMIAEGDKVASRLTWRGTHQGDLMGIPPTGTQVTFTMMAIHRIVD